VLAAAPRLERFARLIALETDVPDPALRLAALAVHVAEDAERLASRLRLPGAQRAVLALAGQPLTAATPERAARVVLHRLGPEDYRRCVLLDWAGSSSALDDALWRGLLAVPERAPVPPFPLAGRDLVAHGLPPGPQVGEALRALEALWIASDFTASREALLERSKELAPQAPTANADQSGKR